MAADKKWLFTLFITAFLSLILLLSILSSFSSHTPYPLILRRGLNYPPAFAYYISGSSGDADRVFRLLLAVYHPRNRYLLHLGSESSDFERRKLGYLVRRVGVMRAFGNVDVVGKPDAMTYMGSSNIAAILRGASILLKVDGGWSWFVYLTALDYPLLTQDVV